jgi:hypothetical protein
MENQPWILFVRVLIKVVNAIGIEAACSPFDTVHHIAFLKQQLREIAAVLACDAGNQGCSRHGKGLRDARKWEI